MDTKEDLLSELEDLTKNMDLPDYRKTSVKWLVKNMEKRNRNHRNFNRAMEICQKLKGMGVSGK